jgi:hypothetical protein
MPFKHFQYVTFLVTVFFTGCIEPVATVEKSGPQLSFASQEVIVPRILTLADAQAIMGEPMKMADSSQSRQGKRLLYTSAFEPRQAAVNNSRTGNLYYLFEQFGENQEAQKKYASTRAANEKNGIEDRLNLGDRAYFHSDNQNFYFIMVLKGNKVVSMKVNKITERTSLDEFNRVAEKIAASL